MSKNGKHKPETVAEALDAQAKHGPITVDAASVAKARKAWRAFEEANLRLAAMRRNYLAQEAQAMAAIAECGKAVDAEAELLRRANNVPEEPGWIFDPDAATFTRRGVPA